MPKLILALLAAAPPTVAAPAPAQTLSSDTPAPVPAAAAPSVAPVAEPVSASPSPDVPQDAAPPQSALGNEIVVSARVKTPADPLVALNAKSFEVIQSVDRAVVAPMAMGYRKSLPSPIRSGLRNFLRNLEEPVSALNYVFQLKPGRAAKSAVRFAFNSTIGVAGLVDVAKRQPLNLPYRPNGFANTFACYGVGPGPFFFLPLAGPITLRDLIGLGIDKSLVPFVAGKPLSSPYYAVPAITIDALNDRLEQDAILNQMREESADPYVATRELYLKQRKAEIAAICPKKGDLPVDPALPPRVGKGVD